MPVFAVGAPGGANGAKLLGRQPQGSTDDGFSLNR